MVRSDSPHAGVYRVQRRLPSREVRVFHCADGTFLVLPADAVLPCPSLTPVSAQR